MEILGIRKTLRPIPGGTAHVALEYFADGEEARNLSADPALVIDSLSFGELLDLVGADAAAGASFADRDRLAVHGGGWQSWSAGWELVGRERLPDRVLVVPELIKFTNRDGDAPSRRELLGHFIMYIRSGDRYLCLASRDGGALPPVTWRIDRRQGRVTTEVFSAGKFWSAGDRIAELHLFLAEGFFAFKDTLRSIYRDEERFASLSFLSGSPEKEGAAGKASAAGKTAMAGGYASWYNHYTAIDEAVILADLEGLAGTDNLIKLRYVDRGRPAVFQIDDGWQRAVGDWSVDEGRFPRGLAQAARDIEARGFIPGLWMAPFLVTRRARVFAEKPHWLLRDEAGEPVVAGFNDKWDNRFFCLDLSVPEVLEYLRGLMDRAIDEWGFRFLKLDFLYAGMLAGAPARGGAVYERYEAACRILTARRADAAGRPVAYLGCGIPFGPSYPHFPLSRIGADTRETWDWPKVKLIGHVGRPAAYINLLDTIGRCHLDGTVFFSDPDVVFLRSANCSLTEAEKELIALTNFLLGGHLMLSDDAAGLTAADLALTRRLSELYDRLSDDEYGAQRLGRDLFKVLSRSGKTVGLINLRSRPCRLDRFAAPDLFTAAQAGTCLTPGRASFRGETLTAAPRSISLFRVKD